MPAHYPTPLSWPQHLDLFIMGFSNAELHCLLRGVVSSKWSFQGGGQSHPESLLWIAPHLACCWAAGWRLECSSSMTSYKHAVVDRSDIHAAKQRDRITPAVEHWPALSYAESWCQSGVLFCFRRRPDFSDCWVCKKLFYYLLLSPIKNKRADSKEPM